MDPREALFTFIDECVTHYMSEFAPKYPKYSMRLSHVPWGDHASQVYVKATYTNREDGAESSDQFSVPASAKSIGVDAIRVDFLGLSSGAITIVNGSLLPSDKRAYSEVVSAVAANIDETVRFNLRSH